jgi:hypothetical protein
MTFSLWINLPITHWVFTGRLLILLLIYNDSILSPFWSGLVWILATGCLYIDTVRTTQQMQSPSLRHTPGEGTTWSLPAHSIGPLAAAQHGLHRKHFYHIADRACVLDCLQSYYLALHWSNLLHYCSPNIIAKLQIVNLSLCNFHHSLLPLSYHL